MIKRWTGKIGGMILTIALTAGMITGCAGKQEDTERELCNCYFVL